MNKVIIIGNLCADPESRTTQSGIACTTFRMAVQRPYANPQGVREADFLNIVTWRQTAELCQKYLSKGRKVCMEGSIQTRSYDAQDGSKRYVTEIVADHVEFLSSGQNSKPSDNDAPPEHKNDGFIPVDDDDLPF